MYFECVKSWQIHCWEIVVGIDNFIYCNLYEAEVSLHILDFRNNLLQGGRTATGV